MKIVFTRHGEAMDDLENRYGGWYDCDLSRNGLAMAKIAAMKMKQLGTEPEIVISSPLRRALQTAREIADTSNLSFLVSVYFKERNTYGLLCGENQEEASKKYPELVAAYKQGAEVLGCEAYDFFLKRVKIAVEKLALSQYRSVICVTHGEFIGAVCRSILNLSVNRLNNNCWLETEVGSFGRLTPERAEGIEFA